jgi:hypothetical protein
VGRRAVLDAVVKRKIPSPRRESNPRTPIVQPVAQHFRKAKVLESSHPPPPTSDGHHPHISLECILHTILHFVFALSPRDTEENLVKPLSGFHKNPIGERSEFVRVFFLSAAGCEDGSQFVLTTECKNGNVGYIRGRPPMEGLNGWDKGHTDTRHINFIKRGRAGRFLVQKATR